MNAKTAIAPSATATATPDATPDAITLPKKDMKATAQQEAAQFKSQVRELLATGAKLGNLALDSLAESLGANASKAGRPAESDYLAFVFAMAYRSADYKRRADLCQKANAKVQAGFRSVAILKARASHANGSASYRINAPVAVDVAIGE